MRLRTRIFRRLVLIALIPSIIISLVAGYFLIKAIDQAGSWISVSSPDRTINSLRLIETRLQETSMSYLLSSYSSSMTDSDSLFDWQVVKTGGEVSRLSGSGDLIPAVDSIIQEMPFDSGMIRVVIGDFLILGASTIRQDSILACGFVFDREYLSGFKAATEALRENRSFQNLMPGFILFLSAAGAVVLVLIVFGAYFISRRLSASITTPLEHLTAVTSAVAQGERPESISITGTEEVSRLAETFNRMIDDLDDSRKRLLAAERVAAWQEFARRLAHEMKNPLTPISLSLYRIKKTLEESGDYSRIADSFEAISAAVVRLDRIAADFSSLAHMPSPKPVEFEFTAIVHEVINLHSAQLENYSFRENLPSGPIAVKGDPDYISQAMVNLTKNAIEFTSPGKGIEISVMSDSSWVYFAVANEGSDVSEADLKAARMPYFSTRKGGTGLGLAISEKIIIDHGGSLSLGLEDGMTVAKFKVPLRHQGSGHDVK